MIRPLSDPESTSSTYQGRVQKTGPRCLEPSRFGSAPHFDPPEHKTRYQKQIERIR